MSDKKNASETLKDTEAEDDDDLNEEFEQDQFEKFAEDRRRATVWAEDPDRKGEIIRKLIKHFSSFVAKFGDDDDSKQYEKLPDAFKAVEWAKE